MEILIKIEIYVFNIEKVFLLSSLLKIKQLNYRRLFIKALNIISICTSLLKDNVTLR